MTPKIYNSTLQRRLDFFILGFVLLTILIFVSEAMRPDVTLLSDSIEISNQREIQTSPELGN